MTTTLAPQSPGLFDYTHRMEELEAKEFPLGRPDRVIRWERFRERLEAAIWKPSQGPGGRPRYDAVKMFKALVAQRFYGLSDEQTEIWLMDRLSFQKFVGLTLADKAPDANTIRDFREAISQETLDGCFADFWDYLKEQGIEVREGKVPVEWENQAAKLSQKDTDARWARKGQEAHFGYKDHVKVDEKSKLIEKYAVTDAGVHDSQKMEDLVKRGDGKVHADSAYRSEEIEKDLEGKEVESQIHEKGYRNHPLTEEQKEKNRTKSNVRARIEHVFGYMTNTMRGIFLRCIGIRRATAAIGLMNLVYNMARYEQMVRLNLMGVKMAGTG